MAPSRTGQQLTLLYYVTAQFCRKLAEVDQTVISMRWKFHRILVGLVVVTLLAFLGLAVRLYEADKEAYISTQMHRSFLPVPAKQSPCSPVRVSISCSGRFGAGGWNQTGGGQLTSLLFDSQSDLVDVVVLIVENMVVVQKSLLERTCHE